MFSKFNFFALSTYFELLNATSTTPATKRAILKKVCSILNENEDDKGVGNVEKTETGVDQILKMLNKAFKRLNMLRMCSNC